MIWKHIFDLLIRRRVPDLKKMWGVRHIRWLFWRWDYINYRIRNNERQENSRDLSYMRAIWDGDV